MKQLVLMRHAQAQLEQFGQIDRERSITMGGMHEIDAIRPKLQGKLSDINLILCSNAKRTRQTLEGIRLLLPSTVEVIYEDDLYHASHETLWQKIKELDNTYNGVMLVGHNPGLSDLVNQLNRPSAVRGLSTCNMVFCETNVNKWEDIRSANLVVKSILTP